MTYQLRNRASLRSRRILAGVVIASLTAAACGGDDDADSTSPSPDAATTEPDAATTEPDAATTEPDAATTDVDPEVQRAFDEFVDGKIPGITIETLQAAKDEGAVVYYTGFIADGVLAVFREQFPFIRTDMVQLSGGPLMERFLSEKRGGLDEVDLISGAWRQMVDNANEGFCESYTPAEADRFPADFPGEMYRWGAGYVANVFVPQRLEDEQIEALRTWEGLRSEETAGMVWGISPQPVGTGAFYTQQLQYKEFGPQLWEDFLANAEDVRLYGATTPQASAVLLGEIDVATNMILPTPAAQWRAGAPIGWAIPEPVVAMSWGGCIATNPPNPNAAKVLWEFHLSDTGQLAGLPENHSFKEGLDLSLGIPESLAEQPWHQLPDVSTIIDIDVEEQEALTEEVKAALMESLWGPLEADPFS